MGQRRRSDGTKSFAVLWRDPETGRQTSLTYDDERDARVAKELIEAAGGRAVEAARIADVIRKPGPKVTDVVSEHVDLLTSVGLDTRAHYRQQLNSQQTAAAEAANRALGGLTLALGGDARGA